MQEVRGLLSKFRESRNTNKICCYKQQLPILDKSLDTFIVISLKASLYDRCSWKMIMSYSWISKWGQFYHASDKLFLESQRFDPKHEKLPLFRAVANPALRIYLP